MFDDLIDLMCLNHLAGNDKMNKPLVDMVCLEHLSRPKEIDMVDYTKSVLFGGNNEQYQ